MIVTVAVMKMSRIMSRDRIWMDASSLSAMVCQHQQTNQPANQPNPTNQPTNQSNQYTNQSIPTRERRRLVLVVEGQRWLVLFFVPSFFVVVVVAWLVAVLLSYLSLSCGPSSGG